MIRRLLLFAIALAICGGSAFGPSTAMAGGPSGTAAIPPLRAAGAVTLPNGRVLPVKPAWVHEASVQAEMLAAHAADTLTFTPGSRPHGHSDAVAALAPTAEDAAAGPIGLADASSADATLAAASALPNGMRKEVFGFLPYWMLDAGSLQWMQYQLVTTIAYYNMVARFLVGLKIDLETS